MRASSAHGLLTSAALIGALWLAILPSGASATSIASQPVTDWASMEEALRILWTGDPAARRAIAERASSVFNPLFDDLAGHDDKDVARILGSLENLVRIERDDFISYRLLSELADSEDEILTPLFLEALQDRSSNLRWAGIRWFTEHTGADVLQDLDHAWQDEERTWVRADLMIALARHGSGNHSDQFVELARGRDASLSLAAIRALTMIGDPQAIPCLTRIVRTRRSGSGLLALDALTRWPESREALKAILEASRSPRLDFQRHAAAALEYFADPAAAAQLYTLATTHADPYVRGNALQSLTGSDPHAASRLALRFLREPPTSENAPVHSAAIGILRELDDPAVLPEVTDLEFSDEDNRFYALRWLIRHLGRERDANASGPAVPTHRSTDASIALSGDDAEVFLVAPPSSMLTIRCWESPEVAGDPAEFPRLPAGKVVQITDHFERKDEPWVRLDENDCWVPMDFIESPAALPASTDTETEEAMLIRREFDLPIKEVESDVALGLMDAGVLEVIDPGDEVVGVALSIDPQDFDRVLLLARSCGLNETMLDGEIYEIVADLAPLYRGHPVFDRFRRTPQAPRGETDEVIDLDIQELSDR